MESVDHQPNQQCSLYINGRQIVSQFDACVRFHINGYHLRQYVQEANAWSDKTWDDIDFFNFGANLKRLSPNHRTHQIKLIHNYLPLGHRRYRESTVKVPELKLCPCCRTQDETPSHFLTCEANLEFTTSLKSFKAEVLNKDIHPVQYIISQGIIHWSTSPGTKFSPSLAESFTPLSRKLYSPRKQSDGTALSKDFSVDNGQ